VVARQVAETLSEEGDGRPHPFASRQALPSTQLGDRDAAKLFYTTDTNCKTMDEPGPTDFVSPCMSEAAIMGRLMGRAAFVGWYDGFMPGMDSPEFKPLRESIDPSMITNPARLAAKSHMIGLAFMRAEEMNRVAAALPPADPRAQALRKLSAINAAQGMSAMHMAGYLGSHFLGAFSMLYLVSVAPSRIGWNAG
jgi:hypothetical protein